MTGMRRVVSNCLSLLLALLAVGMGVVWVDSHWHHVQVERRQAYHGVAEERVGFWVVASDSGTIRLIHCGADGSDPFDRSFIRQNFDAPPRWAIASGSAQGHVHAGVTSINQRSWDGFKYGRVTDGVGRWVPRQCKINMWVAPIWFYVVLFGLLPSYRLVRRIKQRKIPPGIAANAATTCGLLQTNARNAETWRGVGKRGRRKRAGAAGRIGGGVVGRPWGGGGCVMIGGVRVLVKILTAGSALVAVAVVAVWVDSYWHARGAWACAISTVGKPGPVRCWRLQSDSGRLRGSIERIEDAVNPARPVASWVLGALRVRGLYCTTASDELSLPTMNGSVLGRLGFGWQGWDGLWGTSTGLAWRGTDCVVPT